MKEFIYMLVVMCWLLIMTAGGTMVLLTFYTHGRFVYLIISIVVLMILPLIGVFLIEIWRCRNV